MSDPYSHIAGGILHPANGRIWHDRDAGEYEPAEKPDPSEYLEPGWSQPCTCQDPERPTIGGRYCGTCGAVDPRVP